MSAQHSSLSPHHSRSALGSGRGRETEDTSPYLFANLTEYINSNFEWRTFVDAAVICKTIGLSLYILEWD